MAIKPSLKMNPTKRTRARPNTTKQRRRGRPAYAREFWKSIPRQRLLYRLYFLTILNCREMNQILRAQRTLAEPTTKKQLTELLPPLYHKYRPKTREEMQYRIALFCSIHERGGGQQTFQHVPQAQSFIEQQPDGNYIFGQSSNQLPMSGENIQESMFSPTWHGFGVDNHEENITGVAEGLRELENTGGYFAFHNNNSSLLDEIHRRLGNTRSDSFRVEVKTVIETVSLSRLAALEMHLNRMTVRTIESNHGSGRISCQCNNRDSCLHMKLEDSVREGWITSTFTWAEFTKEVNASGDRLMHLAARYGASANLLIQLLSLHPNPLVNSTNCQGETFMHLLRVDEASPNHDIGALIKAVCKLGFGFRLRDCRGMNFFQSYLNKLQLSFHDNLESFAPAFLALFNPTSGPENSDWLIESLGDEGAFGKPTWEDVMNTLEAKIVPLRPSECTTMIDSILGTKWNCKGLATMAPISRHNHLHCLLDSEDPGACIYKDRTCLGNVKSMEDIDDQLESGKEIGNDANEYDRYGRTPLMAITLLMSKEVLDPKSGVKALKKLLAAGASLERVDAYGDTVLHQAARLGVASAIMALVENRGSILDAQNRDGRTGLDLAEQQYLQSYEEERSSKLNGRTILSILILDEARRKRRGRTM